MADGASLAEPRSERRWKRRLLLSHQTPPLPLSKRRRVGARKSSPPHPVVVIDLEDDDSVPDSKIIDVCESSVPGNDVRRNQTLRDLPEQNLIDELTRRARKRTLDARDARVSQGNGLAIACEMIANGYCDEDVIETRKGFDVMEDKSGRLNNDGGVNRNGSDTCFSYGGGLVRSCQVPVNVLEGGSNMDLDYKFFLDNLGEEEKCRDLRIDVGGKAMNPVIDHGISSIIGKQKMGSLDEEGPCSSRRNCLDAMEERDARLDHDDDAEANYAERHNSKVIVDKNTGLDCVGFGGAKYKCTKGKSLEVVKDMDSRLGRDGDSAKDGGVEVNFFADCNPTTRGSDDAKQHCASGGDDVEYLHVSDAGDVNYYYLSDDDLNNNSHDLDSDGMADECYKIFLRCLKPDGEIADFLDFKGEMKRYGTKSNQEERPGLKTPFNSFTPRNNGGLTLTSIVTKQTKFADKHKFREELINVLKRPYNQNEYEKLWKEISIRRPIELQRELRGKTKRYSVDRVGKSYLDHHPDLASAITSMEKDTRRVLNQLRGFFYWLENLSHQGSFVPWKDPVCLQVLPKA